MRIVVVHGVGQQFKGEDTLLQETELHAPVQALACPGLVVIHLSPQPTR